MIDDRTTELINCDLDGTISGKEKEELASALDKNSEAKELYVKMSGLEDKLRGVEVAEPPAELKGNIMEMLPDIQIRRKRTPGLIESIIAQFKGSPKFQLAGSFSFGFAAALVLMMVIISPQRGNLVSPDGTAGTIAINETDGKFVDIATEQVQINDNSILVSTSRSGSKIRLEMNLQENSRKEFTIRAGSELLTLISFERSSGEMTSFEITDSQVEIKTKSAGIWEIVFDAESFPDKEIIITVENNGLSVSEAIAIQ